MGAFLTREYKGKFLMAYVLRTALCGSINVNNEYFIHEIIIVFVRVGLIKPTQRGGLFRSIWKCSKSVTNA